MRKTGPTGGIMIFKEIYLQHASTPVKFKVFHTSCKPQNFLRLTFPHILNKICLEVIDKAKQ